MILKSIMREDLHLNSAKATTLKLTYDNDIRKDIDKTLNYIKKNTDSFSLQEVLSSLMLFNRIPLTDYSYDKDVQIDWTPELAKMLGIKYHGELGKDIIPIQAKDEKGRTYFILVSTTDSITIAKNGMSYQMYDSAMQRHNVPFKFFQLINGKWMVAIHKLFTAVSKKVPADYTGTAEDLIKFMGVLVTRKYLTNDGYAYLFSSPEREKFSSSNAAGKYYPQAKWISDYISKLYEREQNNILTQKYVKTEESTYSKVYMTKPRISQEKLAVMEDNPFLKSGFRFVELDDDIDLEKFHVIAKEWDGKWSKILPKTGKAPELRFRKLGQHRANGIYFPTLLCICVDIRSVDSFIHEYAHHIDFNAPEMISLSEEFLPFITAYRRNVDNLSGESYVAKKKEYYNTPTEIFARASELYFRFNPKFGDTSFLKKKSDYTSQDEYKCFGKDLEPLMAYMNTIYG